MSTNSSDQSAPRTAEELLESRSGYGLPEINLSCARKLKRAYREGVVDSCHNHADHDVTKNMVEAHDEAMEMCLTKIARAATGQRKADNYDDLIGYATLAKKMAGFKDENND